MWPLLPDNMTPFTVFGFLRIKGLPFWKKPALAVGSLTLTVARRAFLALRRLFVASVELCHLADFAVPKWLFWYVLTCKRLLLPSTGVYFLRRPIHRATLVYFLPLMPDENTPFHP